MSDTTNLAFFYAIIPVLDIERAKYFYSRLLGIEQEEMQHLKSEKGTSLAIIPARPPLNSPIYLCDQPSRQPGQMGIEIGLPIGGNDLKRIVHAIPNWGGRVLQDIKPIPIQHPEMKAFNAGIQDSEGNKIKIWVSFFDEAFSLNEETQNETGSTPSNMVMVNDENFLDVIQGNEHVLLDVWASWCEPCKRIAPIVEELALSYKDKICVGSVNVDYNSKIPSLYDIHSIPTLLFFRKEKLSSIHIGEISREDLITRIEHHLQLP